MSTTTDFLDGVIGVLVAAGAGVTRTGTPYLATETAIALNSMPDDPDNAIVLTSYQPGNDDPFLPMGRLAVQVRTRGDVNPRTEIGIRDACYAALHGLKRVVFGSVTVAAMQVMSSAPMGRDARGRWEYATHYYAVLDMPATANRP